MADARWIIWGVLLLSIFLYGGFGLFLLQAREVGGQVPLPLLLALAVAAAAESGAILAVPRLMPAAPPPTRSIVRWALAESIGLYGLVLGVMGAAVPVVLGFVGWSVLLMLLLRPATRAEDGAG